MNENEEIKGNDGSLQPPKGMQDYYRHNSDFREIKEIVNDKGVDGFADIMAKKMDRRKFIRTMGFATAGLTLPACPPSPRRKRKRPKLPPSGSRPPTRPSSWRSSG